MKKELYICHDIPQIEVDDSKNVPTVVYYDEHRKLLIGSAALASAQRDKSVHRVIRDFKLALGFVNRPSPTSNKPPPDRQRYQIGPGEYKSAVAATGDFLLALLRHANVWLADQGAGRGTRILLAEPLVMEGSDDWLSNYRRNITALLGQRFVSDDFAYLDLSPDRIDFMPEPFAVFQYYRYGAKLPALTERRKIFALVIDFGGGTFDTCIIETTREGDISATGKHSRPLAANSLAVGGFYLNQVIAEELLRKAIVTKQDTARFRRALDVYNKWRTNK
jgi:molecular chaperone DnaK (HSP70)